MIGSHTEVVRKRTFTFAQSSKINIVLAVALSDKLISASSVLESFAMIFFCGIEGAVWFVALYNCMQIITLIVEFKQKISSKQISEVKHMSYQNRCPTKHKKSLLSRPEIYPDKFHISCSTGRSHLSFSIPKYSCRDHP